jgi:chitinase
LREAQGRLVDYCYDPDVDVFLLAFLVSITDGQGNFAPALNFANASDRCDRSKLTWTCPEIESDIKICQRDKKKTILLSLGGATSPEQGFHDDDKARVAAQKLWDMFGPPNANIPDSDRPFGTASVDGFDFDFEHEVPGMGVFGQELHRLIGGDRKGARYLTGAPQCPMPHQDSMFNQIPMDMVFVQFYNNPQCNYNFREWDEWAARKNVRWAVGLPAASRAAGAGYIEPGEELTRLIRGAKEFDRMSGAMLWDASQAWGNRDYHTKVKDAMESGREEGV